MKNMAESMPNHAQDPEKKLEVSEEEIDQLVEGFKEGDSDAELKRRAEAIENMIAETMSDFEAEDAKKTEREKQNKVERTGIIYTEAAKAAADVLKENLNMALQMSDTPEGGMLLVQPVQERLQKTLDPAGGFSKLHEDPKVQQLYKVFTDKILHEAVAAVATELENRYDAAEATKDQENMIKLARRIVSVEASDPGGDKE